MSLAALLNMGKKEEESKPKEEPPLRVAPLAAPAASAKLSGADLKMAQELAKSQEKVLAADMEKRAKEEEAWQKKKVEEAAKEAAARASEAKRMSAPANPFCTGGQEFTPGIWVCDKAFGGAQPKGAQSSTQLLSKGPQDFMPWRKDFVGMNRMNALQDWGQDVGSWNVGQDGSWGDEVDELEKAWSQQSSGWSSAAWNDSTSWNSSSWSAGAYPGKGEASRERSRSPPPGYPHAQAFKGSWKGDGGSWNAPAWQGSDGW